MIFISNEIFFDIWAAWLYCTTLHRRGSCFSTTCPSPLLSSLVIVKVSVGSCSTQMVSSGQIFYCLSVVLTITLSWDLRNVLGFTVFITSTLSPTGFTRIIWITSFSIFRIKNSVSTSSNFVIFTLFFCRPGSILTI